VSFSWWPHAALRFTFALFLIQIDCVPKDSRNLKAHLSIRCPLEQADTGYCNASGDLLNWMLLGLTDDIVEVNCHRFSLYTLYIR
jgi:hypothetical protein